MKVIGEASPLLLGSASPRRRALLSELRLPLIVEPAEVEEERFVGEAPHSYLERIADAKLQATQREALAQHPCAAAVLVADTIVVVDGDVLGKPTDVADAQRLLRRIVGRTHQVFTRYALVANRPDAIRQPVARTVRSDVRMRAASPSEIERYAATGEGLDKAGAYAVQGIGAFLVESIQGSWTNVVGLPLCEVVQDLAMLGVLGPFP